MNTLKEIAATIGVPESTLRVYRDEFDDLIPVASGEGRRRRYGAPGVEALRLIVEGKREGKNAASIRTELMRRGQPRERAKRRDAEGRLEELAAMLTAQTAEITLLRAEVGALRTALRELTGVLRHEESAGRTMEEVQIAYLRDGRRV